MGVTIDQAAVLADSDKRMLINIKVNGTAQPTNPAPRYKAYCDAASACELKLADCHNL